MTAVSTPASVERQIFDAVFQLREPVVRVDSPPGAGKTFLNESLGGLSALHMKWRVALVTPKNDQAYDLATRVKNRFPRARVELLHRKGALIPPAVGAAGVVLTTDARQLSPRETIVVATVDKFSNALPCFANDSFQLVVVDEAFQTTVAQALGAVSAAPQVVMVGDPGQLKPFVEVDVARFEDARDLVHWSLPDELERRFPGIPRFGLPHTRRLPLDTIPFVQPAFYPELPFSSLARPEERRVTLTTTALHSGLDDALDAIGQGASLVMITLPPLGFATTVDEGLSQLATDVARRLLERGASWPHQGRPLAPADIAYVDAHVNSGTETSTRLARAGIAPAFANTPEVVQGRQAPIVIAKHPLSGVPAPSSFEMDPGRLCVMLSRHQLACVVVTRADVPAALSKYEHDCGERRAGRPDAIWAGYQAHRRFYELMDSRGRIYPT
jgi:AAA domain